MNVPINAAAWTLGCIALYTSTLKSWLSYRRTQNPLARIYSILSLTFGTALGFFGIPGLFTQNLEILRVTYFMADLFVQISMQLALWLWWFLALRNRFRLRWLLAFTIPFSVVLMTLQGLTSHVELTQSPLLINYIDEPPVLVLKSIIYMAAALPLGVYFLHQAPNQLTLRAKMKSVVNGLIFIIICAASVSNNIFDQGSDTQQSAAIVASFFVVFFLAQLPRPSKS